jgi:DNA-binding response OmpR family regulator
MIRILHIEDDETISGIVKEMLETEGWTVETSAEGKQALAKSAGIVHYDLLLIDYDLPGVNGLEIVRRARNLGHRVTTPIVVLSASPVEGAAREADADVFLQKPLDVNALVEPISRLLGEGQGQEPS